MGRGFNVVGGCRGGYRRGGVLLARANVVIANKNSPLITIAKSYISCSFISFS